MVGWHHRLNGHEFEQTLGDSEGQGSLACCSSWGCKDSDMTQRLNSNKKQVFQQQAEDRSSIRIIAVKSQDYQSGLKTNKTYLYTAYKKGTSSRLNKDLNILTGKRQEKIYHINSNQKKVGMLSVSDHRTLQEFKKKANLKT